MDHPDQAHFVAAILATALLRNGRTDNARGAVECYREILAEIRRTGHVNTDSKGEKS